MIKNIIFDIGNVLAAFDWEGALNRFNFPEEEYEAIADAVFRSSDWNEMDRGVMTVEEVTARFCKKVPQYAEDVKRVIGSYSYMIRHAAIFLFAFYYSYSSLGISLLTRLPAPSMIRLPAHSRQTEYL